MKKFRAAVKFWPYRALGYGGLYLEIFSATCRWIARVERPKFKRFARLGAKGWQLPSARSEWKSFVTTSLVAAGYLPPLPPSVESLSRQKYVKRGFHPEQPETIQQCLTISSETVMSVRADASWDAKIPIDSVPSIPVFCLELEQDLPLASRRYEEPY